MGIVGEMLKGFTGIEFTVYLWEIGLLLVFQSFCLVFGKNKLGLLITYMFVAYWGLIAHKDIFIDRFGVTNMGMYVYLFFCLLILGISLIAFSQSED